MKLSKSFQTVSFLVIVVLISGCSGDDGIIGTGFDVSGAVQKGPFVIGSSINVNFLDALGKPTTETIPTSTTNNLGAFGFNLAESQLVKIEAQGYHLNELTGNLSKSELTLKAIFLADGTSSQTAYVHVLTHLIHQRVLVLISSGSSPNDAITTAQNEFVVAFNSVLPVESLPRFTLLSIYDLDTSLSQGNAYLLALSATLYQYATNRSLGSDNLDAELTFILNTMSDTLKSGTGFGESLLNELAAASRLLRPDIIEENLKLLSFDVIQERLAIPDINRFIDTDGDGVVNYLDDDDDGDGIPDGLDTSPYTPNDVAAVFIPLSNNVDTGTISFRLAVINESLVSKIEYLINGELVGESILPPYLYEWNPYYWSDETGDVFLNTRITDVGGNTTFGPSTLLSANLIIDNPLKLAPGDNTQIRDTNSISLSWLGLPDSTNYQIQLWNSDMPGILVVDQELSENTLDVPNLPAGVYQWQLRASNNFGNWGSWGSTRSIKITGPLPPFLLLPLADASIPSAQDVSFSWSAVTGAIEYEFQVANNPDFTNPTVSLLSSATNAIANIISGKKYWRVRSLNSLGHVGEWASIRTINVGIFTGTYGGQKEDYGSKITQTSDGGYIIIGTTKNFNVRNSGIYLLKLTANGKEDWYQVFDTVEADTGLRVIELTNGDFFLSGLSSNSYQDTWLIQTDPAGIERWNKVLVGEKACLLVELTDGIALGCQKYVSDTIVGLTTYKKYVPNIYRYNLAGTELWAHTFDETVTDFETINSIDFDSSGNFVIAGSYDSTPDIVDDTFSSYVYIYTLTSDGLGASHLKLSASTAYNGHINIKVMFDGTYIYERTTWGFSAIGRYDAMGNIIWETRNGIYIGAQPLIKIGSNEIIHTQYGEVYTNGVSIYALMREIYDLDGYLLSESVLIDDGASSNRFYKLHQVLSTSDGGYILLENVPGLQGSNIRVTKMDADGNTVN